MFPRLPKNFLGLRQSLSQLSLPVVPEWVDNFKPSWILLIRFLALIMVVGLVYGVVVMRVLTWRYGGPGQIFPAEAVRQHIKYVPSARLLIFCID